MPYDCSMHDYAPKIDQTLEIELFIHCLQTLTLTCYLGLDFSHNYLIGIDGSLLINCTYTKHPSPLSYYFIY